MEQNSNFDESKETDKNIANGVLSKNKVNVDIDPDTDNNKVNINFCSLNITFSCCLFSAQEK